MRAYRLDDAAPRPGLMAAEIPQPQPGPGEVLIHVFAAGVTMTELSWYPSTHTVSGAERRGAVPGHEFSGYVAAAGEGVAEFAPGQQVFGMNDWFRDGATAEYCVASASALAVKPARLSHPEAASVPIPALTAWQGLVKRAKVGKGDRVLVHGGAGGVGIFAIQIARLAGARVTATASAANAEFVKDLGAEQVIDYRAAPFETEVGPMDIVFDTVGGETLARSWSILKPQGRMVTIVSGDVGDERSKKAFFIVEPDGTELKTIADMLEDRRLRTVVDVVVPWAQAPESYAGTVKRSHRGKVVIAVEGA